MTRKERMKFIERIGRMTMSVLLSLVLVVGMCPVLALPVMALNAVPYMDAAVDGTTHAVTFTQQNCTSYTTVTADQTSWTTGWYVVSSNTTISDRITVTGAVNLILTDGATLTASQGITVLSGNTLNIYGQSAGTGKLIANGPNYYVGDLNKPRASCAGIGGYYLTSSGEINIHGGVVEATGGGGYETSNGSESSAGGAGIGGGGGKNGTVTTNVETGSVTIYGGKVSATGGGYDKGKYNYSLTSLSNSGAGIGSGGYSGGNTVIIYGGEVTAITAQQGAGIGGGIRVTAASVTIHGGTVTATGGYEGAGIGGGYQGNGCPVTIHGGTVTATGGNRGAGIGGGDRSSSDNGAGGTVTINGGTVTATGGNLAAGIGGGGNVDGKAGGAGGTVTINGGTVTAIGNFGGAGIGGGCSNNNTGGAGGTVTINGGDVTATGKLDTWYGMGIGGGYGKNGRGNNGTLTVGSIVAVTTSTNGTMWTAYDGANDTRTQYMKAELSVEVPIINDEAKTLSWTYGDTVTEAERTLSVEASVSDGGTLSYQWYSNTTNSASGGTAIEGATETSYTIPDGTDTGAGTHYYYCVVTNTLEGGAKKAPGSVSSLTVAQKAVTLEWGAHEFTYNGTAQAPAATVTGLLGTDTCTVTVSGEQTDSNAKTSTTEYTATASALSNSNYKLPDTGTTQTFTIARKAITITAANQTVERNESIKAFASDKSLAALSGALSGHALTALTLTGSDTSQATTSGTVTPSAATIKDGDGSGSDVTGNYAITYQNGVLTVTTLLIPAPDGELTMSLTYGQKLSDGTVTGTMKKNGDEVAGTFVFDAPNTVPTVPESPMNYPATFRPTDTATYAAVPVTVKVTTAKADQPAPTLTKTDETVKNKKDGTISGVSDKMEYSSDGGSTWTAVPAGKTKLEGLAKGTYQVRLKADENHNVGDAAVAVVNEGAPITVTFDSKGGSAVAEITGKGYGDNIDKPADPTRDGFKLAAWCTKADLSTQWDFANDTLTKNITLYAKWAKVHTVTVTVTSNISNDVTLKLVQGNKLAQETVIMTETSVGSGVFKGTNSFANVDDGIYNLVAMQGERTKTEKVTLAATDDNKAVDVEMPHGNTNSVLDVTAGTRDVVVGQLDAEAETVKQAEDSGDTHKVTVAMTVAKETATTTQTTAIQAVADAAADAAGKNMTVEYLNVDVTKQIDANPATNVTETSNVIELVIPFEKLSERTIYAYRYHDGETQTFKQNTTHADLTFRLDTVENLIHLYTKKFSTYAIGYTEGAPAPTSTGGGSGWLPTPAPEVTEPVDTGVADWLITDDHIVYLNGYDEDGVRRIRPEGNITRAEVAMIFYRLLRNKDVTVTKSYTDVSEGEWYAQAVGVLSSLGILNGYEDGAFRAQNPITRAEFTAIATRFAKATGGTADFLDVQRGHWAYGNIATAADYGWVSGYGDGNFGPNGNITRAEVAAIVNRMLGRAADEDWVRLNPDKLRYFLDLQDPKKWYYFDMVEASNEHGFTKESSVEKWTVK